MEFLIKTDIKFKIGNHSEINFSDGKMELGLEGVKVSGKLKNDEIFLFSSATKYASTIYTDLIKNVEFSNSFFNGDLIEIKHAKNTYVKSYNISCSIENGNIVSWVYNSVKFNTNISFPSNYYIITIPFRTLSFLTKNYTHNNSSFELRCNERKIKVCMSDYLGLSGIECINGESVINDFLSLLSFYTKQEICPIMYSLPSPDNGMIITWNSVDYDITKNNFHNYELNFIDIDKTNNIDLVLFLEKNKMTSWKEIDKKSFYRAVKTYVNTLHMNPSSQFITLYSILDKYVGNHRGKDHYFEMGKEMINYGIDITKICKSTDPTINKLNLELDRETKPKPVQNFCDLRDYIVHFMISEEIEEYLEKDELISKMKFAVVIILLKELGFTDCSFIEGPEQLSIMIS